MAGLDEMAPCPTVDDAANRVLTYAVLASKCRRSAREAPLDIAASDRPNLFLRKSRQTVTTSSRQSIRAASRPVLISGCYPFGGHRVKNVVVWSAYRKVSRFNTSRVATSRTQMPHDHAFGNRALISQFPHETVGTYETVPQLDLAIPNLNLSPPRTNQIDQEAASVRIVNRGQGEEILGRNPLRSRPTGRTTVPPATLHYLAAEYEELSATLIASGGGVTLRTHRDLLRRGARPAAVSAARGPRVVLSGPDSSPWLPSALSGTTRRYCAAAQRSHFTTLED
jgi:hypothetical protein